MIAFLSALLDAIGRAFLAWRHEIRAEATLRDLGATTAALDAIRKAEADEKTALDAARAGAHGMPDDPFDRAGRDR